MVKFETQNIIESEQTYSIRRRVWSSEDSDEYLVVPVGDIQVMEERGWKEGEKVKVKIIIKKEQ